MARRLGLAESSIKRILTARDGSVGRLVQICEVAGVRFADLVASAHEQVAQAWVLDEAQEDFFLADLERFELFADLYVRRRSRSWVRSRRGWSAARLAGALAELEAAGLLEVSGRRSLRFLGRGPLAFRAGSRLLPALQARLAQRMLARLLGDARGRAGDSLWTREWLASPETLASLRDAVADAVERAERAAARDEALRPVDQLVHASFLGGLALGELP